MVFQNQTEMSLSSELPAVLFRKHVQATEPDFRSGSISASTALSRRGKETPISGHFLKNKRPRCGGLFGSECGIELQAVANGDVPRFFRRVR